MEISDTLTGVVTEWVISLTKAPAPVIAGLKNYFDIRIDCVTPIHMWFKLRRVEAPSGEPQDKIYESMPTEANLEAGRNNASIGIYACDGWLGQHLAQGQYELLYKTNPDENAPWKCLSSTIVVGS